MLIAFYFLSPVPVLAVCPAPPCLLLLLPSPLLLRSPQGAIRTSLSLPKCFVRVEDECGSFWTLDDEEFKRGRRIS